MNYFFIILTLACGSMLHADNDDHSINPFLNSSCWKIVWPESSE